jgi:hypothetical protein
MALRAGLKRLQKRSHKKNGLNHIQMKDNFIQLTRTLARVEKIKDFRHQYYSTINTLNHVQKKDNFIQ